MFLQYTLLYMKIKSDWFEPNGKFSKIGYKGYYLYLQLFRFRLHNQQQEHVFSTSVKMLRQYTGYKIDEIIDLLKILRRYKIIHIENITNWSTQLHEHSHLLIVATDVPGKDEDFYININLPLMDYYIYNCKLHEKYCAAYALFRKMSNGNPEKKSYMSINKMADILGYSDDYVNVIVREMNKNYLLCSLERKKENGEFYYEHYVASDLDMVAAYQDGKQMYRKQIDDNIKKWNEQKLAYEKKRKVTR